MSEKEKEAPRMARRVAVAAGKAAVGAVGLWSGAITIAGEYGVPLGGFAAWTLENSWWMFPLAAFGCGIWVGWSLKSRKMEEDGITADRIAELEARLAPYEDEERQIERALESCGGDGLAQLWMAFNMRRAFSADECPGSRADGTLEQLGRWGLLERAPDGARWTMPLDVLRYIDARPGLQDRMEDALGSSMEFDDIEADFDRQRQTERDVEALRAEPYWQKVMLACLRDKGKAVIFHDEALSPEALDAFREGMSDSMARMVEITTVGASGTRIELSDEGAVAVHGWPDLLRGVNWRLFAPIDEEFADDSESGPFTVTCQGMQWLVNVNL